VALKTEPTGGSAFALSGTDVLGSEPSATAYDQNVASGVCQYRVKAEKAGQSPQYKTSSMVTVDKINSISGSISVAAPPLPGPTRPTPLRRFLASSKGRYNSASQQQIYYALLSY
jgi:hypothetical protein